MTEFIHYIFANIPTLGEIFTAAITDPLNELFAVIIGYIIVLGLILAFINKLPHLREFLPSLCGMLGIFGTFLGIFLGLSNFDSNNISGSIPPLLDGMKLAFFTSIVGMTGTILLKIIYALFDGIHIKGEKDAIAILKNIEISSTKANLGMESLSETLNKCFKSDEKYSLVSQVRLIRQEMSDNSKKMERKFDEFSEQFAKMASESLVNELKNVVDKFNAMLNDLVSQSFIDLKNSTERLNQWQSEHKDMLQQAHENLSSLLNQISSLNTIFNESLQRLDRLATEIDSIDGSLSAITLSGESLERISGELDEHNQSLNAFLEEIAETGKQAKAVVPEISQAFSNLSARMDLMQEKLNDFVEGTCKSLENHTAELQYSCQKQMDVLDESIRSTTQKIAETDDAHTKAVRALIEDFNRYTESIQMASDKQIQSIEHALETELNKSLEQFAGMMVSLSNKFASDYLPLTERLEKLVRMAEGVLYANAYIQETGGQRLGFCIRPYGRSYDAVPTHSYCLYA